MLEYVSVRRFTRRWTLIVFFNMVDLSLVNAFALYKHIYSVSNKSRRTFLKEIAEQLHNPLLNRNLKTTARKRKSINKNQPNNKPPKNVKPTRCEYCERKNDKKTSKWCSTCYEFYCPMHTSSNCFSCF